MPSPIVTSTIQASVLSLISNILAQTIQAYRSGKPFTIDPSPLITFTIFSIISTPPNYLWQELIEGWFPTYGSSPPPPSPSENGKEKPSKEKKSQQLSTSNVIKKFFVDQAISGPLNTLAFLAFMKGVAAGRGAGMTQLAREVIADFPALHIASLKLWPLVAILSFTLVPMEQRVLFGSLVALGWNVYLGLVIG